MASASSDVGSDVGHSAPVLRIPAFPPEILLPNWRNNRADSSKLNTAAYSIRCTLASMCGMHVHRTGDKRKHDIWACCEEVYGRLLRAMQHRHGEAAVTKYLGHTSLTMVAKMTGEKFFACRKILARPSSIGSIRNDGRAWMTMANHHQAKTGSGCAIVCS